jgi:YD repeat-containing protein
MTAIRYSDGTSMEMAYYSRAKNENIQRLKDRDGTVTEYGYTFYDTPGTHFAVDVNVKAENGNPLSQNRYEYFMSYTNGVEHLDRLINTTNGDRIDTVYNPDGYPLSITTAQGTTTIAYDDRGHVIRKATPTETTKLTYDRTLGKVSSVTVSRGKVVERSQFAYDVKGNLARAEDSKHRMVVLQYDEVGRISVMTDQNNRTLRFTYNRQSKPTTMELDGIGQIHVTYNDSGEITKVDSDQGHTIASQVTEFFQELLDVIRPAGVSLSF